MVYHLYVNRELKGSFAFYQDACDAHWNYILDWCSAAYHNESRGLLHEVWRYSWDTGLFRGKQAVEIFIRRSGKTP